MELLFYVYSGLISLLSFILFCTLVVHSTTKKCGMSREKLAGVRLCVFLVMSIAISGLIIHYFHIDDDIERVYHATNESMDSNNSKLMIHTEMKNTSVSTESKERDGSGPNMNRLQKGSIKIYMIKSVNCHHCHHTLPTFEDFGTWVQHQKYIPNLSTELVEVNQLAHDRKYSHLKPLVKGVPTFVAEVNMPGGKRIVQRTHMGVASMDQLKNLARDAHSDSKHHS